MRPSAIFVSAMLVTATAAAQPTDCSGRLGADTGGVARSWFLASGGFAAFGKMNINIDGYGKAYHPNNFDAGAVIHLCNAGQVFLPDGTSYQGSESNSTCTGRFMNDVARIGAANWTDARTGAVSWFGILGTGSTRVGGVVVRNVVPVMQKDGSGFFVSPTALADATISDVADQRRYVDPVRTPAAVVPRSIAGSGAKLGTFGVAIDRTQNHAVPFIVGDIGPRIGEGSPALARAVAGLPRIETITKANRFAGQVDGRTVLWVFFGGAPVAFSHAEEAGLTQQAASAFEMWGGINRLRACLAIVPRN